MAEDLGSLDDVYVKQENGKKALAIASGGAPLDIMAFELGVNMGFYSGYTVVDKFGANFAITALTDPEDIWEGGGLYSYDAPGTAPIVSVISSLADVQPIEITGLDINGDLVTQTITLTGNTRKALDTPLWRVFRMENVGTVDISGIVYCYVGTGGVPAIGNQRALINGSTNQTLMALYTIPKGKVGFLYRGEFGVEYTSSPGQSQQYLRASYQSRRIGKIFKVKKVVTLITQGASSYMDKRSFPDIIPALTDIKLNAIEVSEDMGVWGTFDILLVDEEKFSEAYLQAIGQPGHEV
jgi:hypothetical protein